MRHKQMRWGVVLRGVALALVALLIGVVGGARPAAAQISTPVATPGAASVPCTNLFGIALGNACVLVLQASPDAGAVDVSVDGALVLTGLTFGTLGEFIPVTAGERNLQIAANGATTDEPVIDDSVGLAEGIAYEVALVGPLADIEAHVLPVNTAPLPASTARLRLVHASPDAPDLDVAVTGGNLLLQSVGYGETSPYIQIPAGTYDLEARIAGTTDLALPLPGTVLASNYVYTIYLLGQVADGSLGAVIVPVLVSPDIAGVAATPVG
jgi:hypothetical protein